MAFPSYVPDELALLDLILFAIGSELQLKPESSGWQAIAFVPDQQPRRIVRGFGGRPWDATQDALRKAVNERPK